MKRSAIFFIILLLLNSVRLPAQEKTDFEQYFRLLEKALQLKQEDFDKIWPGYNLNNVPIGLYSSDEAYLINHPEPGEIFTGSGKKLLNYEIFYSPEKPQNFYANTSIKFSNHLTSIFSVSGERTPQRFYDLLFHEVFHTFQKSNAFLKGRYGNIMVQPFFPLDNLEYYSLAYLEQLLLKDALEIYNKEKSKEKIQAYYEVLSRRSAVTEQQFSDYEYGEQINEGTATYAGYKGAALMDYDLYAKEQLNELLEMKITEPTGFRRRCYATGCALSELLDRFYADWKNNLTEGFNLPDILKIKVPKADNINLENVYKKYSLPEIKKEFKKLLKEQADIRIKQKEYILKPGYVEIAFPDENFLDMNQFRFDPMNISLIEEDLLYHKRMLILGKKDRFEFRAMGHPVLNKINPGNLFTISRVYVTIPEDAKIQLNGTVTEKLLENAEISELNVTSKTLNFSLKNAELKKENKRFLILMKN